jgi:hypothetical protein
MNATADYPAEGTFRAVNGSELWTLLKFQDLFPLYPDMVLLTYKIYMDITLQQEYDVVQIVPGDTYDCRSYCFEVEKDGAQRTLIPIPYSENLDLSWYCHHTLLRF